MSSNITSALGHSVALSGASLLTFWVTTHVLKHVYFVSKADDLLGGMWAVIAALFVYRSSYQQSHAAALTRVAATSASFALCLIYLAIFAFHLWGVVLLVGVGTFLMTVIGRSDDVVVTDITTVVILVVAAVSPHDAWIQPILRLFDTVIGVVVGLAAAWITGHLPNLSWVKRDRRQ
jgi:uncharacterized membrane protein YccC